MIVMCKSLVECLHSSCFLGNGYAALVPSNLPRLRELSLMGCDNVRDEYVEELEAAVPRVVFCKFLSKRYY